MNKKKRKKALPLTFLLFILAFILGINKVKDHWGSKKLRISYDELSEEEVNALSKALRNLIAGECKLVEITKVRYGDRLKTVNFFLTVDCESFSTSLPQAKNGYASGYFIENGRVVVRILDRDYDQYSGVYGAELQTLLNILKRVFTVADCG